jgi:hypothetical protein
MKSFDPTSASRAVLLEVMNVFGCCFPRALPEKVMRFSKRSLPH